MPVDALRKQWDARAASAPLHCMMTFEGDALVLGAGTKLALVERDAETSRVTLDVTPLIAKLSAAYRRPIDDFTLRHIKRALATRAEGKTVVALTHLALTGLPRLTNPVADARRLFMADELLQAGVGPQVILKALELSDAPIAIERRYNPDQPRVPAGSGRESGQWTDGDAAGSAPGNTLSPPPWDRDGAPNQSDPAAAFTETISSGGGSPDGDNATSGDTANRPIQIADNSPSWAQYLNPIGEAEAATLRRPAFNGNGPNDQHTEGVRNTIQRYQALGFEIVTDEPICVMIPGFLTCRFYDIIVRDPTNGKLGGLEVKTTLYDTVFFDPSQVDKDVALIQNGGVFVAQLGGRIEMVGYETYCTGCGQLNFAKADLFVKLKRARIPIQAYSWPGGGPPI
jgi:hypothetical protein